MLLFGSLNSFLIVNSSTWRHLTWKEQIDNSKPKGVDRRKLSRQRECTCKSKSSIHVDVTVQRFDKTLRSAMHHRSRLRTLGEITKGMDSNSQLRRLFCWCVQQHGDRPVIIVLSFLRLLSMSEEPRIDSLFTELHVLEVPFSPLYICLKAERQLYVLGFCYHWGIFFRVGLTQSISFESSFLL